MLGFGIHCFGVRYSRQRAHCAPVSLPSPASSSSIAASAVVGLPARPRGGKKRPRRPVERVQAVCSSEEEGVSVQYKDFVESIQETAGRLCAEDALGLLDNVDVALARSQVVYNGVVESFAKLFGAQVAEKAGNRLLQTAGRVPKLSCYNIILKVYAREGLLDDMLKTWKKMSAEGVKLDVVCYSIILHALGKSGDTLAAEKVAEEMMENGVRPNIVTFNSLLSCLAEHHQFDRFWYWRSEMQRQKIQETSLTAMTIVDVLIDQSDVDKAEDFVRELIRTNRKKVKPQMLTRVMNAYASRRDVRGVERCRNMFVDAGIELGGYGFNVMLKGFREVRDAEGMVRTSRLMRRSRVSPDAVTFTTLMKACASRGDVRRVRKCFLQMARAGIKPDVVAYNTLLNAIRAAGAHPREAQKCLTDMEADGVKPDAVSYNTVMKLLVEKGDTVEARNMYDTMLKQKIAPTEFTFNTLIDACGRAGDVDGAERAFSKLSEWNLRPSVVTLTSLIHAHARNGDLYVALRIFRQMPEHHRVRPNKITYSCLTHELMKHGMVEEAQRLCKEAEEDGIEVPPLRRP